MNTLEMQNKVNDYLDSRGLKDPNARKNAAKKILAFMDNTGSFIKDGQISLPTDKDFVLREYRAYKDKPLNQSEVSVLNLIYQLAGIRL